MNRSIVILAMLCALVLPLFAQTGGSGTEKTVEEAYLAESLEGKIIFEHATSSSKGLKQDALLYIKDAIDGGRRNEDIHKALDYLSLEGIVSQTRLGGIGRVTNNYPDVRARACELLGELGTPEARATLIKAVYADNEPMVIGAAFRALGKIGKDPDGSAVAAISYVLNRYNVLLPDNSLADDALIALEQISDASGGLKDSRVRESVMMVAEGNYIIPVKNRAKALFMKLIRMSSGKK